MGVFDDIYSGVKNAADFAGKKTGEMVEITKLRMSAADLQSQIRKEFEELGKIVYDAAKECGDCTEKVHSKAEKIDKLYEQLSDVNEKITELKRMKKCPECGFANSEDASFCSKCGAKL